MVVSLIQSPEQYFPVIDNRDPVTQYREGPETLTDYLSKQLNLATRRYSCEESYGQDTGGIGAGNGQSARKKKPTD